VQHPPSRVEDETDRSVTDICLDVGFNSLEKLGKGYVEDSGSSVSAGAASTPTAGGTGGGSGGRHVIPEPYSAGTPRRGKHPFLFYGSSPNDYTDGDLTFDVRFAETPDAAGRLKIAEAFEKAAYKSPVDPDAGDWRWCGPWALSRQS
jgi:hypothetical protein